MNDLIPNIVYYNDDHSTSTECTGSIVEVIKCTYTLPSTWRELAREIEHGATYLAFHIDMITKSGLSSSAFISAIHTIRKFCKDSNAPPIKIMVLITPSTPRYLVDELRKLPVSGIGLDINYYPLEEIAKSTEALRSNVPYWPGHILNRLPGYKIKYKTQEIELSFRQQQILNLIQSRGISNRQIADTLKIKEGTVKLHVGLLLKKYGLQNRTQLANL